MAWMSGSAYPVDSATDALLTVDYDHHEIHSGGHFFVEGWQDVDGAATVVDFLWVVPNTAKWPHALWELAGEAEFTLSLYEGVTTSNDGTPVTIFNSNRNLTTKVATVTAFSAPTVTNTGTLILTDIMGAARSSGSTARNHEFIGKQNTKYLFRITKSAAGTHWLKYAFRWYEHTNKR